MPSYNSEGWLTRCIDSLIPARCAELEILIIDDGSTDSTGEIADSYAKRYPETVRIIHKANGGWGTCVNLAIDQAEGIYLKIIDSDDWMNSADLPDFIQTIKHFDVDIVQSSYTMYEGESEKQIKQIPQSIDPVLVGKTVCVEDLFTVYSGKWTNEIHHITYRTDFLRKIGLHVDPCYYTDLEYIHIPFLKAEQCAFTAHNLTCYFRGREGQSTSISGYRKHFPDMLCVVWRLSEFYAENSVKMSPAKKNSYRAMTLRFIRFLYYLMLHPFYAGTFPGVESKLRSFDKKLKELSPELYRKSSLLTRRCIPFLFLWRYLHINCFHFAKGQS